MSNKKATKRALLTSVLAICLCLVMLIGSTFAWFTDTASTGVNQIQSGTLDVELVKPDQEGDEYVPLGADALKWVAKDGRNQEEIFWEPGASYDLEGFRIKNNGNLALKYKVVINGIIGNAELLNAIDFTYKIGEASLDLNEEGHLKAGEVSEVIAINGKMKEEAGNEYMNKSITGIAITVYATQDTVEADSFGTTYDENAAYKLTINTVATGNLNVTQESGANATVKNEQIISSGAVSVTYPDGTMLKEDVTVTGEVDKKATVEQKLEYKGDTARGGEGVVVGDGKAVAAYELTLPVDENNTTLVAVELDYVKNLSGVEVYHNGVKLATSAGDSAREYFTYDRSTGKLVMYVFHASPIDIVFDKIDNLPANAKVVKTADELKEAVKEENAYILLGNDIDLASALTVAKTVTIDLNGKTLSSTNKNTIQLGADADLTVKDSGEGGKITNAYSGNADATTVDLIGAGAKFTLLSGTIESNAKDNLYTLAIGNSKKKDCTVTIAGGIVTVPDNHVKSRAISASNGMMLNVAGGTVAGGLYGIDAYTGSTTTITGGAVSANAKDGRTDEYGKVYGIHAKSEATITVGSMDVDSVPTVQGIKFESSGVKTELPTINLVKGKITSPIYSLEAKYNYGLFKLGIAADAPVTFVDDTAQYFLPDGLQMENNDGVWTVKAQ